MPAEVFGATEKGIGMAVATGVGISVAVAMGVRASWAAGGMVCYGSMV